MELLDAIFLGAIQGLTEFLPVSSSGHLVLGGELLGLSESHMTFDVVVHVATLLVTLGFYRASVVGIGKSLIENASSVFSPATWLDGFQKWSELRLLFLIVVGSVPTAVIGLLFKDELEGLFGSPRTVSAMLLVTAGILWLTTLRKDTTRDISELKVRDALLIGLLQGFAVVPGISRSGSTIACALLLGVERELAARFSFLLSVPAILGALLLQVIDVLKEGHAIDVMPMLAGFIAAVVVGIGALKMLIPLVNQGRLHYFALYLIPVGLLGIYSLS